jgi:CubicO group peptidase (beta-lactamase class C family)
MWPYWLLAIALLLGGCRQSADGSANEDPSAAIARVVTDLRSEVSVTGRDAPSTYSLEARMAQLEVPGVSIAVAENGRIAWARGFGVLEAETADSVTSTTLFQAASVSKPIAATGILRLVAEGGLDLDVPVNDYLASWKLPENDLTIAQPVTLRHLISHGAGTTVWGFPGYEAGTDLPTVPQILDGGPPANTPPVRVDLSPGKAWRYSGGGVTIAQLAVADVTGEEFSEVMDRLVLSPFGMEESTFDQPLPRERLAEAASGHQEGGALPGGSHVYPELAAAGLWTTPTDLVSWAIEIARALHGESTLLPQNLAREMLTPQNGSTGLGPSLGGVGEGFFFGHSGANAGFRAQLVYFPETGQGAAVMSNGERGGVLNREILLALGTEYGWPEYAEVAPIDQDPSTLDAYLGTFAAEQLPVTLTMVREGGRLFVEGVGALGHQELVFLSPDRAMSLGTGTELVFTRSPSGEVTAVESMSLVLARQE